MRCSGPGQDLSGAAPAGSLGLVYMRCLDTGKPCAALPRHNSLHHKHCYPKLKSAHSRKKDNASQMQTAACDCSVCFPCSGSFDETVPHSSVQGPCAFSIWACRAADSGATGMTVILLYDELVNREKVFGGKSFLEQTVYSHLLKHNQCLRTERMLYIF